MFIPNIGNSLFPEFNDSNGIMLCGYEWGYSKADQKYDEENPNEVADNQDVQHTFSNKAAFFGPKALNWKYDQTIIKWFELWGHQLNQDGSFEKCILQTNWCNTQDHRITENYWEKLLAPEQITNFINHIELLKPKLILFFGSQIIKILQSDKVLPRFQQTMGKITEPLVFDTKSYDGRKFNVAFQSFENCKIVCLPHPRCGQYGLSDDYIGLFSPEIGKLFQEFKEKKSI